MTITRRVTFGFAAAALAVGLLAPPASAHKREITQVYAAQWDNPSTGEPEFIDAQAWVDPECHKGVMKLTLKKKRADGTWANVATKKPSCSLGWGYHTTFDLVAGDKRCKVKAVFTSQDHPTLTKTSDPFDC